MARIQRLAPALALGALLAPPLAAQVLEEVVVTAQKREQSVQDVGISVTAYTGDQIHELGFDNAQEVTALAPGVSTLQPNGPSNYAIAIRGVAQNDFISNQESPVSVYIDDVYLSQMSSAGFMLFDMERVEILRGPQGTLFGRNATGGLAHYITRKPSAEFGGYAQLTGGSYEQVKFEGAVGGPITDNFLARLSVATHNNGGYVRNRVLEEDINNANDYAARLQFLFYPRPDMEFLLNVRGAISQVRTGFFENVSARFDPVTGNGFNTPGLANFNGYRDGDDDNFAGDYDLFGHQDLESYGVTGTFTWDLRPGITLTSLTDYQGVKRDYLEDSDASPVPDFNFYQVTDAEQFSQELRINGDADRWRWVAGFYYLEIDVSDANGAEQPIRGVFNTSPALSILGFPAPLFDGPGGALGTVFEGDGTVLGVDNPYDTETTSWSLFGQVEYDFTQQWTGIVGFRWIDEEKEHIYQTNLVDYQPGFVQRNGNPRVVAPLAPRYFGEIDDGLWSAKVELDYKPNDDWLLFASWNRGVKGGGFNAPLDVTDYFGAFGPVGAAIPLTDANMQFDEEKLDAFEAGFKASLFGGLARLNASAFYYDYKDYQAFQILGLTTFIFNADAESHGFEVEFQSSPLDGLDFMFGVGYLDVEIPNVDIAGTGTTIDTEPVQSPDLNINGLLRYAWPFYDGTLAAQANFQYRSRHFFSLTKAPASTQPGYVIGNARLSYTTDDERWETAVFVNNIADEEYRVQTFDLGFILGMTEEFFGLPRWVGGSVRYSF